MTTSVLVNLDALAHNVREALRYLRPQSRLMAVVKANAYGHGLVETARAFVSAGAAWLGVSTAAEGLALRQAGLDVPVLVFLPPLPEEYETIVRERLTATIVSTAQIRGLGEIAQRLGRSVFCHIYIDSGLGRLGADESLEALLQAASVFPSLHITGVYTHCGPPGSGQLLEELNLLEENVSPRAFAGLTREAMARLAGQRVMIHVAASALFLAGPQYHFDLVRLGTLLYGQYPDYVQKRPLSLREDTFALQSRIIALQTLPPGSRIGYGGEFVCRRETRVATVPVGLAHGLGMSPESAQLRPRALLKAWLQRYEARRGRSRYASQARCGDYLAPIIGRISMDQCCLDVTDIPNVQIGQPVILPVRRVAVDSRIPRVYVKDPPNAPPI